MKAKYVRADATSDISFGKSESAKVSMIKHTVCVLMPQLSLKIYQYAMQECEEFVNLVHNIALSRGLSFQAAQQFVSQNPRLATLEDQI